MRFLETQNEMGVYDVSFNFKTLLFKQENSMITLILQFYILLRERFQLYEPLHVRHYFFWPIGKKNVALVVTFET